MSATVERLEPGIILLTFDHNLTVQDVVEASNAAVVTADAAGDAHFVTINVFADRVSIPFDIQHFKNLALRLDRLAGAITVGAPTMTQLLARMIDRLTSLNIAEAKSVDEAVVMARRILAGEPVR